MARQLLDTLVFLAVLHMGHHVGLTSFAGPGGNASIQSGLPTASYQAILPATNFDNATGSTITGSIKGTTNANGTGVTFSVNFASFPSVAAYGPFGEHPSLSYQVVRYSVAGYALLIFRAY